MSIAYNLLHIIKLNINCFLYPEIFVSSRTGGDVEAQRPLGENSCPNPASKDGKTSSREAFQLSVVLKIILQQSMAPPETVLMISIKNNLPETCRILSVHQL